METKKASIKREESNTYLILGVGENPIKITLTDDNPNNVKSAFNLILKELIMACRLKRCGSKCSK